MAKVHARNGQKRQENSIWTQPMIWCIPFLVSMVMNLVTMPYIASLYMQAQGGSKTIVQEERKLTAKSVINPIKEMGSSTVQEISVSLTSGSHPVAKDSVINLDQ